MKVIALKSFTAVFGNKTVNAVEGQVLDLSPREHKLVAALVAGTGTAEAKAKEEAEAKAKEEAEGPGPETAALAPPETEAMPDPRKRGLFGKK